MADQPTLKIKLTREQEMQLLAATGLLVGSLELSLEEVASAEVPRAIVPQPVSETGAWDEPSFPRPR